MSEQDPTLDEFADLNEDRSSNQENNNIREEGFLKLPRDWNISTVSEVAKEGGLVDGDWIESADMDDDGKIQLVQLGHIGEGQFKGEPNRFITEEFAEEENCTLLSEDDLLISRMQEPILRSCLLPSFDKESIMAVDIARLQHTDDWNRHFLKYLFNSRPIWKQGIAWASGTTRKRISRKNIEKLRLPTPPFPEQRKIATVLYTVDQAIEKTEEITYKYQSIVSGLIQDIATTGINNQHLEEQKVPMLPERWEIPKHWNLEFLENITTLITDGAHITPTYVENGMPFLKVENIKQEKIEWDSVSRIPEEEHNDLIKSGNPTKGDVLLSKNGTIGITKVVDWDREFSHFVSLALIRPKQDIILSDYLSTLLESQICMRQAEARSKTGTVTNLHLEEIEKLSIPVPPVSEQKEILEKISAVENCLSAEMRYLNRLQRLKQGLMQDLLSGKVRTTDTNITVPDEVAQHG